ncbi:transmembrane protein 218-like [Folsomia candida]|uniref:Uncharacterized protein n=1 Tax=Folsomia candida TaxID=158441 RepID=A0A226DBI7_FOLCA|nr:transmembrane protein 218-like [Folsomia candida]OXA42569.1 hypothetical protein Fcan01_22661 [Folsomia candida]
MAGSFVVGLGAGVVILLVVWTVVLIAWVQLSAHQAGLRSLITGLSILITLVLLLIPTAKEGGLERRDAVTKNPDLLAPIDAFQVYDYMFIWKGILMAFMSIGIIVAFGVYVKEFWAAKVHGSLPVPTKKIISDFQ